MCLCIVTAAHTSRGWNEIHLKMRLQTTEAHSVANDVGTSPNDVSCDVVSEEYKRTSCSQACIMQTVPNRLIRHSNTSSCSQLSLKNSCCDCTVPEGKCPYQVVLVVSGSYRTTTPPAVLNRIGGIKPNHKPRHGAVGYSKDAATRQVDRPNRSIPRARAHSLELNDSLLPMST